MLRLQTAAEETSRCEISRIRNAALQNDERLLDELLRQDAYRKLMDCRGGWGVAGTPLHAAASQGHLGCLRVLLGHGALADCVDVKAQTPLFAAVQGKHLDCVLALLAAGAAPDGDAANNGSPVLTAARQGDAAVLRELLRRGAEVNDRAKAPLRTSRVSSGPLYLAAVYGHAECFRLLLLYGADPDYNRAAGRPPPPGAAGPPRTVLEVCLRHGCGAEFVRLLIDFGANVYLPTLIIEKSTKRNEAVELLLRCRGTPMSLKSQCRLAVRRSLRAVDGVHGVERLGLPTSLQDFLQHAPAPVHCCELCDLTLVIRL